MYKCQCPSVVDDAKFPENQISFSLRPNCPMSAIPMLTIKFATNKLLTCCTFKKDINSWILSADFAFTFSDLFVHRRPQIRQIRQLCQIHQIRQIRHTKSPFSFFFFLFLFLFFPASLVFSLLFSDYSPPYRVIFLNYLSLKIFRNNTAS